MEPYAGTKTQKRAGSIDDPFYLSYIRRAFCIHRQTACFLFIALIPFSFPLLMFWLPLFLLFLPAISLFLLFLLVLRKIQVTVQSKRTDGFVNRSFLQRDGATVKVPFIQEAEIGGTEMQDLQAYGDVVDGSSRQHEVQDAEPSYVGELEVLHADLLRNDRDDADGVEVDQRNVGTKKHEELDVMEETIMLDSCASNIDDSKEVYLSDVGDVFNRVMHRRDNDAQERGGADSAQSLQQESCSENLVCPSFTKPDEHELLDLVDKRPQGNMSCSRLTDVMVHHQEVGEALEQECSYKKQPLPSGIQLNTMDLWYGMVATKSGAQVEESAATPSRRIVDVGDEVLGMSIHHAHSDSQEHGSDDRGSSLQESCIQNVVGENLSILNEQDSFTSADKRNLESYLHYQGVGEAFDSPGQVSPLGMQSSTVDVEYEMAVEKFGEQVEASASTSSQRIVDVGDEILDMGVHHTHSDPEERGSEDRSLSVQQESFSESVICEDFTKQKEQALLALEDKRNQGDTPSNRFTEVMGHHQGVGESFEKECSHGEQYSPSGMQQGMVVRKSDEQVEASVETLSRRRVDMDDEGQNINIYGTRSGAQEHGSEDRGLSLQQESYSENVVCEILTESTEQDLLALVDKRNEENMSTEQDLLAGRASAPVMQMSAVDAGHKMVVIESVEVRASTATLSKTVDIGDEVLGMCIHHTHGGAQECSSEDHDLSLEHESCSKNVVCEKFTNSDEQNLLALVDKRNEENMSSNSFIGVMAHHQYFGEAFEKGCLVEQPSPLDMQLSTLDVGHGMIVVKDGEQVEESAATSSGRIVDICDEVLDMGKHATCSDAQKYDSENVGPFPKQESCSINMVSAILIKTDEQDLRSLVDKGRQDNIQSSMFTEVSTHHQFAEAMVHHQGTGEASEKGCSHVEESSSSGMWLSSVEVRHETVKAKADERGKASVVTPCQRIVENIRHKDKMLDEGHILEDIYAIKKIVGYKGEDHTPYLEQIAALYLFLGMEPYPWNVEMDDLERAQAEVELLKTVVGVK
ncbi:hypothetical protein KP509_02G040900 [Ceratopteris richardii]|uniref:Uncharacterized protein n=1 Tax=Ceratopteris richardii TaxID=49495 RepID=A0A8T2VCU4_CERRI|nr:hypothetical protein KP509_02G040900 [Ceratopteris richardii]KAH7443583.1 hypothetical protein KP509_02G040900 [Ceratopteris richardii]